MNISIKNSYFWQSACKKFFRIPKQCNLENLIERRFIFYFRNLSSQRLLIFGGYSICFISSVCLAVFTETEKDHTTYVLILYCTAIFCLSFGVSVQYYLVMGNFAVYFRPTNTGTPQLQIRNRRDMSHFNFQNSNFF